MISVDIEKFIKEYITLRQKSLFSKDLQNNQSLLAERINGRSVLVIGGAGTIGSSYIKALLKFKPQRLYVVDINENGLTELTRDLRSSTGYNIPDDYKPYPISYCSSVFQKLLKNKGPFEIVANFAAHKHVRSEKDHFSIEAMIRNNVVCAKGLLDNLLQQKPEHFFCVSTDKAANPVNVMGASKKIMEDLILAYSDEMTITTARFANVAFSNGSLLAGFLDRLIKRQPFSSPSDVKRYFVSPEESGQLCLLACILGESGDIFYPKLKEEQMITFSSIADQLLKEYGLIPDYCSTEKEARDKAKLLNAHSEHYPVYYFKTDTSGEKLFEEFFTENEETNQELFQALGVIKGQTGKTLQEVNSFIKRLETLFADEETNKLKIVKSLQQFIPNFEHIETGKALDQKM